MQFDVYIFRRNMLGRNLDGSLSTFSEIRRIRARSTYDAVSTLARSIEGENPYYTRRVGNRKLFTTLSREYVAYRV